MRTGGAFGIRDNTLAPAAGRLICPWARSESPGYRNGGNKFDLHRWDPAYFRRLREFVSEAGRRGIVVELVLFCTFYEKENRTDAMWKLSAMNAENSITGVGNIPSTEVYPLNHPSLLAIQEALVRRIVEELREADNVCFEICNEPYWGNVASEWQDRIAKVIADAETHLDNKHLIAQNIANKAKRITDPNPLVSVFSFHYAKSPLAVSENYHLNRVIADDETGFKGQEPGPYRREAWEFILSGGAVFSHFDYSFTCGKEDGTVAFKAPGGGGREIRRQLVILKQFIESFDFVKMRPEDSIADQVSPKTVSACVLVAPGHAYAVYLTGGGPASVVVELPAGTYEARWMNTQMGDVEKQEAVTSGSEATVLRSPVPGQY